MAFTRKTSLVCAALALGACNCAESTTTSSPPAQPPPTTTLSPLAATRAVQEGRFATSPVCADCHSNSSDADAMRDELDNSIGPFDLWQSSMMANAARDPLWRAAVSAEVAAIPSAKANIESTCMTCHAPMAVTEAKMNGESATQLSLLYADSARSQLGLDGVSCTSCHQIQSGNLGTAASFSGNFTVGNDRVIYGPHANPFSMPMQNRANYTPTQGDHISRSALCASCHTLHTNAMRPDGSETGDTLAEQTPYLEWRNSIFNTEVATPDAQAADCQDCHAPKTSAAGVPIVTALARNPGGFDFPPLDARSPYGRHTFVGGNTLIPQILRDNRAALNPLASTQAFDATIALARQQLRERTATLAISTSSLNDDQLTAQFEIAIATGHKFPSAHPSRRAWLHVVVKSKDGATVFESGRYNSAGVLTDAAGKPLASEVAGGPYLTHVTAISDVAKPLVYEVVMGTSDGAVTYRLLQGARYLKDNRLLPKGWSTAAESSDIAPAGVTDGDFTAGGDAVSLALDVPGHQAPFTISATLLYQPLSARYAAELFAIDTPETRAFRAMYESADRTPDVVATSTAVVAAP